ncbi:MAG: hypothetical protein AAGF89_02650, partial [Bacteroidota bacterium]
MDRGLRIDGDVVVFNEWPEGEIWWSGITDSFRIKIDDIRVVAISPRLSLDDEILIVTLINKEKEFKQFSSFEFGKEPIKEFEKK